MPSLSDASTNVPAQAYQRRNCSPYCAPTMRVLLQPQPLALGLQRGAQLAVAHEHDLHRDLDERERVEQAVGGPR